MADQNQSFWGVTEGKSTGERPSFLPYTPTEEVRAGNRGVGKRAGGRSSPHESTKELGEEAPPPRRDGPSTHTDFTEVAEFQVRE